MTTAIAVYDSSGCVGRCDARCHDAREPDCDCICSGRLHGVGRDRAININTELLREDVERWAKAHGVLTTALRVEVEQQLQLDLGGS